MTTEEYHDTHDSRFDYANIDGDHSYEGVSRDYELFWPTLSEGGIMTFHDTVIDKDTEWGKCGVKKFWNEVSEKHNSINIPLDCGLGIIQK